ncbi:ferritin-like domain-containing protein [Flavobacterium sp. UBA6135]|uniref:YciE/YciF ferroxidase family protein n=1 Tax=Flavobacterium sp. UBA6135 TaxID=1946553 RepID=UPI0025BA0ED3|nr:ferritin-like domain-containing protein [Flavobacterium sp. UBA6135]
MNTTKTSFSKNGQSNATHMKQTPEKVNTTKSKMQASQLMQLFEEELKDIYWAEKALTKAIPKMIKNATSEKLIDALTNHLVETEQQAKRIEEIFKILGKKAEAEKCEAMAGLMKESDEIIEACETGAMRDAGIISAAQKVEHYEIASYGTLSQFAQTLGLNDIVKLLDATLQEEKNADLKLTEVAVDAVNVEAAEKKA